MEIFNEILIESEIPKEYWYLYILDYAEDKSEYGLIRGSLKFEKIAYKSRNVLANSNEITKREWKFIRDSYGPRDPGLSEHLVAYMNLGLAELQDIAGRRDYSLTEKGKKYFNGITHFFKATIKDFNVKMNLLDRTLEENVDKSGSELIKTEDIQESKKERFGKEL